MKMDLAFVLLITLTCVDVARLQEACNCENLKDFIEDLEAENIDSRERYDKELNDKQNEVQHMENEIKLLKSMLEAQVKGVDKHVAAAETEMESFKSARNEFIGFAAYSDVDEYYMSRDDRFILNQVTVNAGGGYSSDTGEFTVSQAGWYLFSLSIFSKDHHDSLQIMKNGERQPGAFGDTSNHDQGSVTWLLECAAGDKVYVQQYNPGGGGVWRGNSDNDQLNSFSGFMIEPIF